MNPTRTHPHIAIRTITNVREWDTIAGDWDRLAQSSPTLSPTLTFTWLREWWRIYGPKYGRTLHILVAERDGRLIGALPLYRAVPRFSDVGMRVLRFLSSGEAEYEETAAEYLDLLCTPGEEDPCTSAFMEALLQCDEWDRIWLPELPSASPLLHWNISPLYTAHVNITGRGTCPIADLSDGFDEYLQGLSANTRQQCRRLLRRAEKTGVIFEIASDAIQADVFYTDLAVLHQKRWTSAGKLGCFAAPRFADFHHRLVSRLLPDGSAILARLSINSRPVAVLYGFVAHDAFHFYQSGIDISSDMFIASPGITGHLMLIRELAGRGIKHYNFLRGSSTYKQKLATTQQSLSAMEIVRPGLRSGARELLRTGWLALRRGRKHVMKAV